MAGQSIERALEGRVALVTGGGAGIGRATVSMLADAGASVAFTDIIPPDVGLDERVRFIQANATIEDDAERAVSETVAAFGRLDFAVNNVGNFGAGDGLTPLHEVELAAWDNTVRQCLTSCMLGMKYALRPMLAAGKGSIVNIASLAGIRVTRFASPAYVAAKAGVVQLSKSSAVLYAKAGIRVNVVAPGLTLTPNIERTMPRALRDDIAAEFHPTGVMVSPEEVAAACVWALSDQASGVNGLVIPVDHGWAAK